MILTIAQHQVLAEALHQLSSTSKTDFASSELQTWTNQEIDSVIDELNELLGDQYRVLLSQLDFIALRNGSLLPISTSAKDNK